jgi:hypothetical protein
MVNMKLASLFLLLEIVVGQKEELCKMINVGTAEGFYDIIVDGRI